MNDTRIVNIDIQTDGSGDFSVETPELFGRLLQVRYLPDDLAAGTDLTITGKKSGYDIVNYANIGASNLQFAPRQPVVDNAGAGITYDGTNEVYDHIYLSEILNIVIAQGGGNTSGRLILFVG